jgi:hypothetical protein
MTYIAHDARLAPAAFEKAAAPQGAKQGLWHKLMTAIMDSRREQAEREVARYVSLHGGVITDQIEREIGRRFLTPRF